MNYGLNDKDSNQHKTAQPDNHSFGNRYVFEHLYVPSG
jgi:hypothetical protein